VGGGTVSCGGWVSFGHFVKLTVKVGPFDFVLAFTSQFPSK
jgi:hypothetical protein